MLVVVVATTGVALVALSVTSRVLRGRVQTQLESAVEVISRGDLALNPAILRNLRGIVRADVITFGPGGEIVTSSFDEARPAVTAAVEQVMRGRTEDAPAVEAVPADCGAPCLVVVRALDGRPGMRVALVAETVELAQATEAVTRAIVLVSALSAIVMVVVGHLAVRRVTAPLARLVEFARGLTPGQVQRRAPVGNDEVGTLAEAFNDMLDRVQRSQESLVRSEKLAVAGLVAARVAHDIRNPLSSIKMQAQLLQARLPDDPDDQATLGSMLHDINQVEGVVRDLVEAARPGDLRREPTQVNGIILAALQQLAPQFSHRKVTVRTALDDRLPDVLLDGPRFRQALLNILVNAAEAMPAGGPIAVEARAEGDRVIVEICDEGVGLDPAIADTLFDPFVSTKREGVGLGLANARAVVEGHGGRITLTPREPRGTCASIMLPTHDGRDPGRR